jgi:long-chain fatty acid transport protein
MHRVVGVSAAMGLCMTTGVQAQGFGVNEIGTCAVARGFAATAAPCADGSAVFWNPAALTDLAGLTATVGVARIGIAAEFAQDTTGRVFEGDDVVEYPPHAFVTYRLTPRLALGAGVYVPYGLTSAWRDDFPGRFLALRASLQTVYAQPTVAWELAPGWSIGGGPVVGYSTVELSQSTDLSLQTLAPGLTFGVLGVPRGTEFARASLDGSATGFGFNVGVHGRIGETVQLGVRYLSSIDFEFDDADASFRQIETDLTIPADVTIPGGPTIPAGTPVDALLAPQFAEGGPLSAQAVRTEIAHPWQLQGGVAFAITSRTTLSAEASVIGWSAFDVLPVDFSNAATPDQELIEDYETSWTLRLGAEHRFMNGWNGRAGFAYSQSPAPDESVTPLLPEQARFNYGVGVGIPFAGRWTVDLGYLRVQGEGRRGRVVERASRTETAAELNTGFYTLTANVLSVGISYGSARGGSQ